MTCGRWITNLEIPVKEHVLFLRKTGLVCPFLSHFLKRIMSPLLGGFLRSFKIG